jgi:hypothetical protein
LLIQNLPGPDLLLYHVESSLLDVHETISTVSAALRYPAGLMH